MFGERRTIRSQRPPAARRVLGAVMAIVLAAILTAPVARAAACPMSNAADAAIGMVSKVESKISATSHASMSKPGAANDCCGKSFEAGGCSIVHDFGCSAALSAPVSNFTINDIGSGRIRTASAALTVYEPAPDFRPPRLTA